MDTSEPTGSKRRTHSTSAQIMVTATFGFLGSNILRQAPLLRRGHFFRANNPPGIAEPRDCRVMFFGESIRISREPDSGAGVSPEIAFGCPGSSCCLVPRSQVSLPISSWGERRPPRLAFAVRPMQPFIYLAMGQKPGYPPVNIPIPLK